MESGEALWGRRWGWGVRSGAVYMFTGSSPAAFTWEVTLLTLGEKEDNPSSNPSFPFICPSLSPLPRGWGGRCQTPAPTPLPLFLRREEKKLHPGKEFGWYFQRSPARDHFLSLPTPQEGPPAWSPRRPLSQRRGRWRLRVLAPRPDPAVWTVWCGRSARCRRRPASTWPAPQLAGLAARQGGRGRVM